MLDASGRALGAVGDREGDIAPRRRLLDRLDQLGLGRVAVIVAPAGYGKRSLVRAWLGSGTTKHAIEVDDRWSAEQLADVLDADREHDHEGDCLTVLLVKAPDLIHDSAFAHRLLDAVENRPNARVIFCGVSRPDIALGSLAIRGRLVDIDAADLAMSPTEIALTLKRQDASVDQSDIDRAVELSGGWPIAVRLLSRGPAESRRSPRSTSLIDSFIRHEVLAGLSDEDLHFLEQMSVLPELDPTAATVLSDRADAAARLARLQALGVPITWGESNAITLNPLLRAHLQRELVAGHEAESHRLVRRGAGWLRDRGRPMEAVRLATETGDSDLAWELAADHLVSLSRTSELPATMACLADVLPMDWRRDVLRSLATSLSLPETAMADLASIDPARLLAGGTVCRRLYALLTLTLARMRGYPASADISLALEMAAQDPARGGERGAGLIGALDVERGLWLAHRGRPAEAQSTLLRGLTRTRHAGVDWASVLALGAIAVLQAEAGTARSARRFADECLSLQAHSGLDGTPLADDAHLARAMIALDSGDPDLARACLARFDASPRRPENDAVTTYCWALTEVVADNPAAALRRIHEHADRTCEPGTAHDQFLVESAQFEARLQLGELDQAALVLGRIGQLGLDPADSHLDVLRARLALARGDARAARELLSPYAALPGRPLKQPKATLHMLMVLGAASAECRLQDESTDAFQRAASLAGHLGLNHSGARHLRLVASPGPTDQLTEAEMHVLTHLSPSMTLGEVAAGLFISVNTLKTHLRRIYRKLGVSSRAQAIERARMLGITPTA